MLFGLLCLYWSPFSALVWIWTCWKEKHEGQRTKPMVRDGKRKASLLNLWCRGPRFVLWEKKSRRIHTRDAHLVLHGSSSWLFIRRRGRLCRRWMFLRTTRGTRSPCRFGAVVSWMEILIDSGSAIFSRTCWKVQDEGGVISHWPLVTWLLSHLCYYYYYFFNLPF